MNRKVQVLVAHYITGLPIENLSNLINTVKIFQKRTRLTLILARNPQISEWNDTCVLFLIDSFGLCVSASCRSYACYVCRIHIVYIMPNPKCLQVGNAATVLFMHKRCTSVVITKLIGGA
jgi:hypothetical protein